MSTTGPKYNRIQEVLDAQGRSQDWLAGQIGRSRKMVNEYCRNVRQPSLELLFVIAHVLGVTPQELIGDGE